MTKRKTRKASWLLTVASAYSVLPGCSDDPAAAKPDAHAASYDGGVTVSSPRKDAATADASGSTIIDTGGAGEVVDTADDIDITTLLGVIIFPPGDAPFPEMDASTNTPPADDASVQSDVPFLNGIMAFPPDSSVP